MASRVIALVQCVSQKASKPQAAKDLYTSNLFVHASAYAEMISNEWFILSAKYGLVKPSDYLYPYNLTLKTMSTQDRKVWADNIFTDLKSILRPTDTVIFLAGVVYRKGLIEKVQSLGCVTEIPMEGLRIGEQVHWLKEQLGEK